MLGKVMRMRPLWTGLTILMILLANPVLGGGTFDGEWRGQAMLIAGATPCPQLLDFRIEFSGNTFRGVAISPGDKFRVQGGLVGLGKIQGRFFNALGFGKFAARYDNGEWRGSWEAEGECDGSIHLTKSR